MLSDVFFDAIQMDEWSFPDLVNDPPIPRKGFRVFAFF